MSASKTNLEKQKRRHRGPLMGIAIALIVASILFVGYLGFLADTDTPEPAPAPAATESTGGMPAESAPATPTTADPDPSVRELQPAPAGD